MSEMQPKKVSESEVTMSYRPMYDEANTAGKVHGGHLIKHMDTAGSMVSMRHARSRVVTASVERMNFLTPILLGEMVNIKGRVNMVGRTSMDVGLRVEVEDLFTGKIRHAASCYMTFVAIDEQGKPRPVPPLLLETEEDRRRHAKAMERRRQRHRLQAKDAKPCLAVLPERYALCDLAPDGRTMPCSFSEWPPFTAVVRTKDACTLVILQDALSASSAFAHVDRDWRAIVVLADLEFCPESRRPASPDCTIRSGIVANLCSDLADAGIDVYPVSAFASHYTLVRDSQLVQAVESLRWAGYQVQEPSGI